MVMPVRGFFYVPTVASDVALTVTKKKDFEAKIEAIYKDLQKSGITFTSANMRQYWGVKKDGTVATGWYDTAAQFQRYIVNKDPFTGKAITFMGRPITGGVNVYMLPLLKAAEAELTKQGITWQPQGSSILGFGFRWMKIGGVESKTRLSSHSAGLSLDIDAGSNGAKYDGGATNRGNIPDEIVLAMVKNGFVWGGVRRSGFEELGDDPMHFQQSLHPSDARYKEILATSPVAKKYWDALETAGKLVPVPAKVGNVP